MRSPASSSNNDITFASKVITENTTIPLILTDEQGHIIGNVNIDTAEIRKRPDLLSVKLLEFKKLHEPLLIDYEYGRNYVYYGDSNLLNQLKYYPLFLIAITALFLLIVLIAFSNAQKSIQNQVWVGMSKETAHQLGTPLSSIVGWMELMKEQEVNKEPVAEMEKDVARLQLIADRFSKIGSRPQLEEENLIPRLEAMVDYMSKRAPLKVRICFDYEA
jgi:signal transduction histidine kinase